MGAGRAAGLAVAIVVAACWTQVARSQSCAFALDPQFTCAQLATNTTALFALILRAASAESAFTQDGIGLSETFGVTYDGSNLNYSTGQPIAVHPFSAASKEAFHAALLALALMPDAPSVQPPVAWTWLGANNVSAAQEMVAKKMASYRSFFAAYPGFGGFLPWYSLNASGMGLLDGWTNAVPALDNGELFWGLYALEVALVLRGDARSQELAAEVHAQLDLMRENAQRLFWAGANGT